MRDNQMKVYALAPRENWICDRFVKEWNEHNPDISTTNINEAEIIWLIADWCWNQVPEHLLKTKKVVCTLYHVVPEKFTGAALEEFKKRDKYVDLYHSMCEITDNILKPYMTAPSFVQNFWANQNTWYSIDNTTALKDKLSLPKDKFLIGSFQRDTEGHDLVSPKLEKGPDIFMDYVEKRHNRDKNVHVVLAGWRRQYVINRLNKAGITYSYFEWADFQTLNELYNCLSMYVVSARQEGGPQAIVECALTETPIISTDVGVARAVLHPDSIATHFTAEALSKTVPEVGYNFQNVQKYTIPYGFSNFKEEFNKLLVENPYKPTCERCGKRMMFFYGDETIRCLKCG